MRFVLWRDRGAVFRFAPLQGVTFGAVVPEERRAGLPDSIVVRTEKGRILTHSDAVGHVLRRLGGGWRLLGGALQVVPRVLRDSGYDVVAAVRKRCFARPADLCPVVPPALRGRFEP